MNQPNAVDTLLRQAQQLIVKNPFEAALQFKAALAAPAAAQLPPTRRVSLLFSLGLAQFASPTQSLPLLQETSTHLHEALRLADTLPLPVAAPAIKGAYVSDKATQLMNQTLAGLAARDCVAFAFGGVLLGLTRDGCLLPFDKDLDVVVPQRYFARVCELLIADGWKRCWIPVRAQNFACFMDAATGITLDVIAYAFDQQHSRVMGGWWPHGLPREEGRLLAFSPFELDLSTQADGRFWRIRHPEPVLAQLYGEHWRVPDPQFDSSLETPALINWTLYTRVWAALKLLEAWTQGKTSRITRIQTVLRSRDGADPLAALFKGLHTREMARATEITDTKEKGNN